jgi:mannose-6-phosphate isomerase-like protein (cupin superfamily)
MAGYSINIEQATLENENFRKVLFTGKHTQLVLMTLKPGEDIGQEVHDSVDQFFRIEAGTGEAIIDGEKTALSDGVVVVIPAGSEHNLINTSSSEPLRLYTLYSPPNHPDGTIHKTKAEADEYEKQHHG